MKYRGDSDCWACPAPLGPALGRTAPTPPSPYNLTRRRNHYSALRIIFITTPSNSKKMKEVTPLFAAPSPNYYI